MLSSIPVNKASVAVALATLLQGAICAEAQIDSNLLREEWRSENHWVDSYDKPFFILKGKDSNGETFGAFHWDSLGRFKLDREDQHPTVWGGYKLLTMSIGSNAPFVENGLYDLGLAVGGKLGSLGQDWTLEASGGVATANDGHFRNTEAIYPAATILAQHQIAEHEFLQLGVTYDGNSELLPALPIPVVEYEARLGPSLKIRAGFPHAQVEFRPWADVSIQLMAEYPTNARFHGEVDVGSGFRLFTEVSRRIDGFHQNDAGRDRIFVRLHTAEGGIRFVTSWIDIALSGGLAFSNEVFTGYDMRDREQTSRPGNRPMVALTVQGTF